MGRTTLFNPKGLVPKISSVDYDAAISAIKKFFDTWKYENQDIKWQLQDRKIPGNDELPNYYYRDDALAIWDALPPKKFAMRQIAQMYVLTRYSDINEFLGDYREFWFNEKEVIEAKEAFQKEIKQIGDHIDKRGWDQENVPPVLQTS